MILADAYDAFLLDLDGVVWRGDEPIRGAGEAVAALRARGKRVVFVTNNSSRTPRDYAVKLMRMKIPTPTGDIVTSAHAVIAELRRLGLEDGDRVHVFGGEGLLRLLKGERFVPVTDGTDARAVVVGWNRDATYDAIRNTASAVRSGLPFVASNADATYPAEGDLLPGTGALLAAIETAAGRQATVVGKPRGDLFRIALARAATPAKRTLFVGDRPETDVVGAREAGVVCALVLSGVIGEADLARASALPEWILDDLRDVLADLPRIRIIHRDGILAANDPEAAEGVELAWVRLHRKGRAVRLDELGVGGNLDERRGWFVVRRLLAEAVHGAKEVDAADEIRPLLERLGVALVDPSQRELFRS